MCHRDHFSLPPSISSEIFSFLPAFLLKIIDNFADPLTLACSIFDHFGWPEILQACQN
jgi:hypothetical protein